jgi:peptide/nickel transport system ATP-binding protein
MIFQDPLSSLHPFYRIGDQLAEAVRVHNKVSMSEAHARAVDALHRVGIPSPDKRANDYPHQLSGGMRQRVMIAMALINSPSLLIADEPTTALDVTVQAQITDLMSELQRETGTTLIIITHDLGVVADMADEVCVMYGGRVVEYAPVNDIYYAPQHPYTQGLLASVPRLATDRVERLDPIPGNPPSLINLPSGCVFHPRCGQRTDVPGDLCRTEEPHLVSSRSRNSRCTSRTSRAGSSPEPSGRSRPSMESASISKPHRPSVWSARAAAASRLRVERS